MLVVALWVGASFADTITLDTGAALSGRLTHYEVDGECRVRVDEGPLAGVDVVARCDRVARWERPVEPATLPEGAVLLIDDPSIEEVAVAAPTPPAAPLPVDPATPDHAGEPPAEHPEAVAVTEKQTETADKEVPVSATSPEPRNRTLGTIELARIRIER